MNKTIYEEAIDEVEILSLIDVFKPNSPRKYQMLTKIQDSLKQAQKQEKLLELYKELSNFYVKFYTMELSELSLNSNYYEIELIKLKQKIKELENDK